MPRVRQDSDKAGSGETDFAAALPRCSMLVCYNGDLITERDVSTVSERYPDLPAVMIGRALIADPSLVARLTGGKAADAKNDRDLPRYIVHALLRSLWRQPDCHAPHEGNLVLPSESV